VGRVIIDAYLYVRTLKGKRLELSTRNLVHIILCSRISAYIDSETKVKFTGSSVAIAQLAHTADESILCVKGDDTAVPKLVWDFLLLS